jgi:PAS domain S-box-containing protein
MARASLNVFHRGLILVAVPIIFQICFGIWLAVVLSDAQKKLQAQWQSEELIRLACQLSRDSTDVIVYMQMPIQMKEMISTDEMAQTGLVRPKQDYFRLEEVASKNPKNIEPLQRLKTIGLVLFNLQQKELESAEQLKRRMALNRHGEKRARSLRRAEKRREKRAEKRAALLAEGKPIPERLQDASPSHGVTLGAPVVDGYKLTLQKHGREFYSRINELVTAEEESMKDTNAFGAGSIAKINVTLLLIALSSIAVTVFLGYLYSVSIRKPLKHLGENGRRLSLREPLLPVLPGNDEFAKLDQLLQLNSKEVEEALAHERAVIENAADIICIIDEKGRFVNVNPFVERMLGYLQEELMDRPASDFVSSEQSLLADEYLRKAIVDGAGLFELRMSKRNGDFADTRWSCTWSQEDSRLFCVVQDITEEKAIEQLKQDFADMISHDLRSPLMAMGNSLTLIEAGVKGEISEDARASVMTSAKNVEKLIALVNDLLDFQKLKAGKMQLNLEDHSLQSIVSEAAELLAETAQQKSLELHLPQGKLVVPCDYNKVLQTVVNLLSNAIKFSEAGSAVIVDLDATDDLARLSVSDSGPGVPEAFREKIFEPFEQAPSARAREGTGLGLAICKLIVEAHGGRIFIEPCRAGGDKTGSRFVVELPLHAKNSSEAKAEVV